MYRCNNLQILILIVVSWLIPLDSCWATSHMTNNNLYPGEEVITAAAYPALVKFIKGNPNKPLIVFVPGDFHLARISYGYPGSDPKDFLSYCRRSGNSE